MFNLKLLLVDALFEAVKCFCQCYATQFILKSMQLNVQILLKAVQKCTEKKEKELELCKKLI